MAYTSGVFDDVEYRSSIFSDMIAGLISNGVNGTNSAYLQVVANTDMVVTIQPGFAWIDGHVFRVTGGENLTISTADGALKRIDRVILRFDKQIYPYGIYPMVLKGGLSDNPAPPALTRTSDIYDICLANIYVAAGTTAITQAMITDTRGDDAVCGYVYGLGTDITTSTIFAQYQAEWQTFKGKMDDDDVAANLQHQIDDLNTEVDGNGTNIDRLKNVFGDYGYQILSGYTGSGSITFSKAFAEPPIVIASCTRYSGAQGYNLTTLNITGITTTGASFIQWTLGTSDWNRSTIYWIAYGKAAT